MRKIVFVLAVCCAMMMQAATYSYLVFTNTDGTTTAFSVSNLTLTVNDSNLKVTNDEGTVNMLLTDLATMQFTNEATAVENVLNGDQPVQVYSLSGVSMGTFGSMVEAAQQLGAGAYVITSGKNAQTIVVK